MVMEAIALASDFALVVVTATVLSYVARQTGQPTIVAYLATGLLLGPVVLGVVTEAALIEVMAELGLGFLLFLLGLEMQFERIREILRPIVNISAGQTLLQTALALVVAFALGFRGFDVAIIALATVFGATPVIVKILSDKDELDTLPGRIDVGVLIVQDIYLVIVLALVGAGLTGAATEVAIDVARILGLIAALGVGAYLAYRYVLPWLLGAVADERDVLFVVGLAWAFLFIAVAESLELSVEVGAFLAGLSLAQLPYSTELKEHVRPLTDFFLVVFFSSIGLRLAAEHLTAYWIEALVASAVMMVGNFLIMLYLIDREGFSQETSFLGSVNMVQVSEFSLVVGALAVEQELIQEPILGYLSLMAVLTMTVSTYVILYNRRLYELATPTLERLGVGGGSDGVLSERDDHAVIVGYDGLVRTVLPVVSDHVDDVLLIDRSPEYVSEIEDLDVEFEYGDVTHGDVREDADLENARFLLSVARPASVSVRLLEEVSEDAVTFVRAETAEEAEELYDAGADYVILRDALAATQLRTYVEEYLTDRDAFVERLSEALERITSTTGGEIADGGPTDE